MTRFGFRLASSAALIVSTSAPLLARAWRPLAVAGPVADGVWRSRGYGHLLVVHHGGRALYHIAGRFCYRDPSGSDADDDSYRLVNIVGSNRIVFAAAPDQTRYEFDRIAALPPNCAVKRHWTAHDIADLITTTFADLYPGFGRRGRELGKLKEALATSSKTDPDLAFFEHTTRALGSPDDAHVGLAAKIDGVDHDFEGGEATTIRDARSDSTLGTDPGERERKWSTAYREGIVGLLEGGGHQVANRKILWGRIGRIGYLNVVAMGGFDKTAPTDDVAALDAVLDDAITAFQGLPGVIVDATNNRGGYDAISLHIAGRFADRHRLAFSKRPFGAQGKYQRFYVAPSDRIRYLGNVALLTSDVTVSAGETFTLAMRALPNAVQMGARTRGAFSDQLTKPLPNGWTLTLPAEDYRDSNGRSLEGIGIDPQRSIPPFAPNHRIMVQTVAERMTPVF
jgi:carboxyl-terminal processing protease